MKILEDLITLSNEISKFNVGAEGNVSAKGNNFFLIKASGCQLKDIQQDDFVKYNFDGHQLNNHKKKGSMELPFHKFLLEQKNINFVCHSHPKNVVKILCTDKSKVFSKKRFFPDQVVFNGTKSCLVDYKMPGKKLFDQIKKQVEKFQRKENFFPKVILLKNHGLIVCGETIKECLYLTEICEKSAEIFIDSTKLGGINFFSRKQCLEIINDKNEILRKKL